MTVSEQGLWRWEGSRVKVGTVSTGQCNRREGCCVLVDVKARSAI